MGRLTLSGLGLGAVSPVCVIRVWCGSVFGWGGAVGSSDCWCWYGLRLGMGLSVVWCYELQEVELAVDRRGE